jgi:hypothetical protein
VSAPKRKIVQLVTAVEQRHQRLVFWSDGLLKLRTPQFVGLLSDGTVEFLVAMRGGGFTPASQCQEFVGVWAEKRVPTTNDFEDKIKELQAGKK